MIRSVNPATEELLAEFDEQNASEVDCVLDAGERAFGSWRQMPLSERAALLRRVAAALRQENDRLARLASLEMGKPIRESEAEVEKCAWNCEYFANMAGDFLKHEEVPTSSTRSYVAFQPLGTILAIMPWNFPFWQVFRFAAPALVAGNVALLKHASNVPQCAMAISEIFQIAGLPDSVVQTLLVHGSVAERMIADPRIRAVTLTGSEKTGALVAAAAGRALKKCVLELGGSDPFLVLSDADIEAAAATAVGARYQNAGQSCIAAKRFIVASDVADEFEQRFVERVAALKVGDPQSAATDIGPLARSDLRRRLDDQLQRSRQQGAAVVIGGERIRGKGYFYQPTVLTGVRSDMPVATEETFGPVAAVIRVCDESEAIQVANSSIYGLGASVWTQDIERGQRIAAQIEAGSVFINAMVASDPRLPFGGVKKSGYGRELSRYGIREFVNIQTVCIGPPASALPAAASQGSQPPLVGG